MSFWWSEIVEQHGLDLGGGGKNVLSPTARKYADAALTENTLRSYRTHMRAYAGWCTETGHLKQPLAPADLVEFLADYGSKNRPSSTKAVRYAISRFYQSAGLEDTTGDLVVRDVMRGIHNVNRGHEVKRVHAAVADDIRSLLAVCGDDLMGLRDAALILVGYGAALRRSELVALDVGDLAVVQGSLVANIRVSKTDRTGRGAHARLPEAARAALLTWLESADITEGPIFRRMNRGVVLGHRLSGQTVALILKTRAEQAGLDPASFSGHSLRRGAATQAHDSGASALRIKELGRWQSMGSMALYVDSGTNTGDLDRILGLAD